MLQHARSGNRIRLVHPRTTSALHQHFYFNHIARPWNYLPCSDKLNTASPHYQTENKTISLGTLRAGHTLPGETYITLTMYQSAMLSRWFIWAEEAACTDHNIFINAK